MKNTVETVKGKRKLAATPQEVTKEFGFHPLTSKQRERDLEASLAHGVKMLQERTAMDPSSHGIQFMDAGEVAMLQDALEHGNTLGLWQTPDKWAGGTQRSVRSVDLRERIVASLEERHQSVVRDANEALARSQGEIRADWAQLLSTAATRVHAIIDGAVVTITRYLLMCRMGPAGMGPAKGRSLDTTMIADMAYQHLPRLLSIAVGKWLDKGSTDPDWLTLKPQTMIPYLALILKEDLKRFSEAARGRMSLEVKRVRMLADMGLWIDSPMWETPIEQVTAVKGIAGTRKEQPKPPDKHLPFPDDYVAEMGRKSLWIIRDLGPNLITILRKIVDVWQSSDLGLSAKQVENFRVEAVTNYLNDYIWRDSHGIEFAAPPFELRLSGEGSRRKAKEPVLEPEGDAHIDLEDQGEDDTAESAVAAEILSEPLELLEWPPRNFAHIKGLIGVLQSAHLFVVSMSLAPRNMELLSLERSCVVRARDGELFASGRTFKLVERHDGELRDWVLPDVAAVAIEQQVRLASSVELIGNLVPVDMENQSIIPSEPGRHLWVQSGYARSDRTQPLRYVGHALMAYARTLGMSVRPGGQKIRTHRFRKTVARLAALALTDAPMILMQVFGHKSAEMTLYYILTDKNLQVEVEQVRRELKIMRGVAVVENMVAVAMGEAAQEAQEVISKGSSAGTPQSAVPSPPYAGYGGPAAPKLFGAVKEQVIAVHRTGREWGASDSYETAYFLTEAGLTFTMPRQGVFCTKAFTQPAACTGKRGKTDPGNCQSDCGHRLELTARRAQLEGALTKQVELYEEALKDGNALAERAGKENP